MREALPEAAQYRLRLTKGPVRQRPLWASPLRRARHVMRRGCARPCYAELTTTIFFLQKNLCREFKLAKTLPHKKLPKGGAFCVEVDQGTTLYTLVDELIRWRELLDNRFKQYQLNNRRAKELYSL